MPAAVSGPAKALSILRSAIVNARIYPKGSQMIESSLRGACQALEECLQESSPMIISDIQGKLCVDGKEVPDARDFRTFLTQHEIQSLKLSKGLDHAEVAVLVEALGKRKGQLDDHKNLNEWFKAQGVQHVQAEEIEFVAIQDGETVVKQVLQVLDQSSGDTPALISSLEESFRLMDQLPDAAARNGVREQVTNHLAKLPPHQMREFVEAKLPESIDQSGLRDAVIQALSREKLEETLEEVHKWYEQIKRESASELEVVEKLAGLKSFLGKVLHSPASKAVSFALYEELLNVGLLEEIPAGVQKGETSSLQAQVQQLLTQTSAALLDPPVRQKFPELLKALCAMGLEDSLQKLTDKLAENLQNPAPLVRETTVKTLRTFVETFAANRKEKPFLSIVSTLHKMADSESSPEVYGEIAQTLQGAAMELLVNWRFEEGALLLATLRRHSREESPIGQKKKQLARKALVDFSVRGLDVVCADLNAPIKDRQNGAYRVLAELGDVAVQPLVEALKRSGDPRSRQAAIQAIKRLGPSVKDTLLTQIHIGLAADVLVKLLPLLDDFAEPSLLPLLTSLLQHPDAGVREAVAQILVKIETPQSQTILFGLLDDSDPNIQAETVRLLNELHVNGLAEALEPRIHSVSAPVQEEMCIVLGGLRDRRAVSSLVKLLLAKGPFWKRSSGTSEAVRVRAVWALGQMLPDPQAEKALLHAQKDASVAVQRVAQNALKTPSAPAAPR